MVIEINSWALSFFFSGSNIYLQLIINICQPNGFVRTEAEGSKKSHTHPSNVTCS